MAKLVYTAIASLDGYVEDPSGNFEWAAPDEEVHAYVNELERGAGTYLYGRRMYAVMAVWQTLDVSGQSRAASDFAELWRGAEKIVFSATLSAVTTPKTRLERRFEPAEIRRLKESASSDISIGGPGLAEAAFEAGLVDECRLFLHPVVIGAGKRALPARRLNLDLLEQRRFASGVLYLRYRVF